MSYTVKHPELLKGVVDMHLHVAPSLIPRRLDIAEMAQLAEKAGYKAIIQKDHHSMSAASVSLVKKHLCPDSPLKVFGSICLNNSVGGLKKEVVETAIGFGARIIWLSTVSAKNHIAFVKHTGKFPKLANGITIDETPIPFVDADGKCRQEIVTILEIISKHPGVVLGTGHGDPDEINVVVEKAAEMGLANRLMIDHPTWMIGATLDQVKHWAQLGCYIEHIAALSVSSSSHRDVPLEHVVELIRMVGPEQSILSSDYGQGDNGDPIEGFGQFFDELIELGITKEEIVLMSNTNPSKLLCLED